MYQIQFQLRNRDSRREILYIARLMGSVDVHPHYNLWGLFFDAVMRRDFDDASTVAEAICVAATPCPDTPGPTRASVYGQDTDNIAIETAGGVVLIFSAEISTDVSINESGVHIVIDFGRDSKSLSSGIVGVLDSLGVRYSYKSGMESSAPFLDMPGKN